MSLCLKTAAQYYGCMGKKCRNHQGFVYSVIRQTNTRDRRHDVIEEVKTVPLLSCYMQKMIACCIHIRYVHRPSQGVRTQTITSDHLLFFTGGNRCRACLFVTPCIVSLRFPNTFAGFSTPRAKYACVRCHVPDASSSLHSILDF